MYELEKQKLTHNLAKFIVEDNLLNLAKGLLAGIKILEQNDALELLTKLSDDSFFCGKKKKVALIPQQDYN